MMGDAGKMMSDVKHDGVLCKKKKNICSEIPKYVSTLTECPLQKSLLEYIVLRLTHRVSIDFVYQIVSDMSKIC